MRKIYFILLGGFLLCACQKSSVDKKEEGLIRYKETVTINDVPPASLTFFEVSDSRCPEGVNCLVAGFAQVDLSLDGVTTEGRITNHVKMCIGCGEIVPDTLDYNFAGQGYRFILKSISPLTKPQTEVKKTDYAISLDIKKI
ncbi:hypothetical protein ACFP1I_19815 [Dyadobacter subterraneus]|uniref:Lipoprotein n=1 Tax=Dyadobacter subterraneus TaxID=2773304 RepID=A0ABR9W6V5_9BACT|nr:hypothetical protein [Dyadobacter subterraneus]MBE9460899.1 hypothetical protein [Dyadobacter subterraneus]